MPSESEVAIDQCPIYQAPAEHNSIEHVRLVVPPFRWWGPKLFVPSVPCAARRSRGPSFRMKEPDLEGTRVSKSRPAGNKDQRDDVSLSRSEVAAPAAGPESFNLYRLLVESVRDYAIFALDSNGYVISWNIGAERIKGYQAHEIIGRHFSTFYPAEDLARGKPDWELTVAADVGRFEDEGWRVRKDGSMFWANVIITALRNEHGG